MKKPTENLAKLNLKIPESQKPLGSYVAHKKIGNLVFVSGQISIDEKGHIIKGKVGKDLSIEEAQKAAKLCVLNIISQIKDACNGDLNRVKNCVKICGFVNSSSDFYDQPKILNTASEILQKIFDNSGKHTRAAVGVNSLPLNAAVEIDAIFEIN